MPTALKKGARVRLIQPVIEGEILRADTNGEEFGYQVAWTDADGQAHERFFPADKLEEVQP